VVLDTSRGLSIQYADGRISTGPVRRTGGMWTSTFPTIAGADTSRNGVGLTTLDVKHVIEGPDVVATVSLYYGGPGQNGVTVATVRLSRDQPVAVIELRTYGVEPITLSLVPIARTRVSPSDAGLRTHASYECRSGLSPWSFMATAASVSK
jgi:hypothetical protein